MGRISKTCHSIKSIEHESYEISEKNSQRIKLMSTIQQLFNKEIEKLFYFHNGNMKSLIVNFTI